MRACTTSSGTRGGACAALGMYVCGALMGSRARNIVTHHAEDGSGVGAALIAGTYPARSRSQRVLTRSATAMTKIRKDAGIYTQL
jgi:hypothetical protein